VSIKKGHNTKSTEHAATAVRNRQKNRWTRKRKGPPEVNPSQGKAWGHGWTRTTKKNVVGGEKHKGGPHSCCARETQRRFIRPFGRQTVRGEPPPRGRGTPTADRRGGIRTRDVKRVRRKRLQRGGQGNKAEPEGTVDQKGNCPPRRKGRKNPLETMAGKVDAHVAACWKLFLKLWVLIGRNKGILLDGLKKNLGEDREKFWLIRGPQTDRLGKGTQLIRCKPTQDGSGYQHHQHEELPPGHERALNLEKKSKNCLRKKGREEPRYKPKLPRIRRREVTPV